MKIGQLLGFTAALLALVNPFAVVGAFLTYADSCPEGGARREMAWTTSLAVASYMLAVTWFGKGLLEFFDISVPALQAAGGLILLMASLELARGSPPKVVARTVGP